MPDVPYLRLVRPRPELTKLTICMPVDLRRALEKEAHAAGYCAVSTYLRDVRLRPLARPQAPRGRTQ